MNREMMMFQAIRDEWKMASKFDRVLAVVVILLFTGETVAFIGGCMAWWK